MRFSKLISRARYALLLLPAFGLLTSIEVGCGVSEPDGIGNMNPEVTSGQSGYGYSSSGYDGYGSYGSSGYGGYGGYGD